MIAEYPDGFRVMIDPHAESLGHGIGRDVVMSRTDAAGREHISIARAQRVQRRDDFLLDVRNKTHLAQINADARHRFRDVADVRILGASGEKFVADDEHGGGDQIFHAVILT